LAAVAVQTPVPTAISGIPAGYASQFLMPPPPKLGAFSSLQVLQLPNSNPYMAPGHDGWWLVCSAPHHWRTLAACTALRELEGLHAAQLPPEGLKFPGVTRLVTAVAAGDVLLLLGAFPALEEVKLEVVLNDGAGQVSLQAHPFVVQPQCSDSGNPSKPAVTHVMLWPTLWPLPYAWRIQTGHVASPSCYTR
jgi:hypothetical protein